MAIKNEDLKTDDLRFDHDLDFDFDSEIDGSLSQEGKKGARDPVSAVVVGALDSVKDAVINPSTYDKVLREALPPTYGKITKGLGDITTGTYELYDQTAKELNPRLNSIFRKLDGFIPESQKKLKNFFKKLDRVTGGEEGPTYTDRSSAEEDAIQNTLGDIFKAQTDQDKIKEHRTIIRDTIQNKQFGKQFAATTAIAEDISTLRQYTTRVTQGYQRKSLEIQLRSYMGQQKYHAETLQYMKATKEQLEAVIKNTSLPEYAKITEMERLKQTGKERLSNFLYGDENPIMRGMNRIKNAAGEYVRGIGQTLDVVDIGMGGLEAAQQQMQMFAEARAAEGNPLTKMEMAGMGLGTYGVGKAQDYAAEKLKPWIDKNPKLLEKLAKASRYFTNPAGELTELRKSKKWQDAKEGILPEEILSKIIGNDGTIDPSVMEGLSQEEIEQLQELTTNNRGSFVKKIVGKVTRGADWLASQFEDSRSARSHDQGQRIDTLTDTYERGFDKKSHTSLNTVIPGYLARIHRELAMMRTKRKKMEMTDFDFDRDEFVDSKVLDERVDQDINKAAKSSLYNMNVDSALDFFNQGKAIEDPDARKAMKQFISRLAYEGNNNFSKDAIRDSDVYQGMPDAVKKLIDERLNDLHSGEDKERKHSAFTDRMKDAMSTIPSLNRELQKYHKAGMMDRVAKTGIIKRTDTGYEEDEDAFYNLIENNLNDISDVNVKKDIKERSAGSALDRLKTRIQSFNPKEAYEGMKNTKLYDWVYRNKQSAKGQPGVNWNAPKGQMMTGPMAQDVRDNLGSDAAPNGSSIDRQSVIGAFFASIQHLGDKIENLKITHDLKNRVQSDQPQEPEEDKLGSSNLSSRWKESKFYQWFKQRREDKAETEIEEPETAKGKQSPRSKADFQSQVLKHLKDISQTLKTTGGISQGGAGNYQYRPGFSLDKGLDKALELGGKAFDQASSMAKTGKEFVMGVGENLKDPTKELAKNISDNAFKVGNFLLKTAGDTITEHIPNGLKSVKGFLKDTWKTLQDAIGEAKDLYLPGGMKPIITAAKLKAGFYIDEATGEVLSTMEQIVASSGNIIDAAGNLILDVEEKAKGLYDRNGEKVRTKFQSGVKAGAAFLKYGYDKITGFAKSGKEALTGTWSRLKGFFAERDISKDILDKFKNFTMPGIGFGGKQLIEITNDIRDILLGQKKQVLDRIKKRKKATKDGGNLEKTSEKADDGKASPDAASIPPSDFVGPMPQSLTDKIKGSSGNAFKTLTGLFDKAKENFPGSADKIQELKDKALKKKDELKEKVESSSLFGKLKGKLESSTLLGKVKDKFKGLKEKAGEQRDIIEDKIHAPAAKQETGSISWSAKKGQMYQTTRKDKVIPTQVATPVQAPVEAVPETAIPQVPSTTAPHVSNSPINWSGKKGEMYQPGKIGIVDKLKNSRLGSMAGKVGGRVGGILSVAGGIASSVLGNGQDGPKQPDTSAEVVKAEQQQEANASAETDKKGKAKASMLAAQEAAKKGIVGIKDRAFNDKDGTGTRDGGVDDRAAKVEQLKASREKDALQADLSDRYGSSENVVDKMMGQAGKLFGFLKDGIGTLFNFGGTLLSKIPGLGTIAKGVTSFFSKGGIASTALRVGGQAALSYGGALLSAGTAMAGTALSAVTAVGGTLLSALSAPVVLGALAVGAAAYGGYKLYKYATRNNANDYDKLRLRQYGFGYNDVAQRFNHFVFQLEEYFQDGKIGYNGTQAYINTKKVNAEEIYSIFDIDPKDEEKAQALALWMDKRFKPFFLAHLSALMEQDPKMKLSEVEKLPAIKRLQYLEASKLPSGPYEYDISPLGEQMQLDVNREEVIQSYDAMISNVKIEAEKAAKRTPLPNKSAEKAPESPDGKKAEEDAKNQKQDNLTDLQSKANSAAAADEKLRRERAMKYGNGGEGDGGKPQMPSGGQDKKPGELSEGSGAIPSAGGPLKDGGAGLQYILASKGVDLDNISPAMRKNLLGMAQEYGEMTGKSIPVSSGKRSTEQQKKLFDMLPPGRAAPPGRSLHEFGIALDMDRKTADELDKMGLMRKYGFTRPVGKEPWHVEPSVIQKSIDLARKDSNERERMVEASPGRGGGGYGTVPNAEEYKRNNAIAMSVINASDKVVKNDDKKSEESLTGTGADSELTKLENNVDKLEGQVTKAEGGGKPEMPKREEIAVKGKASELSPVASKTNNANVTAAGEGDGSRPSTPGADTAKSPGSKNGDVIKIVEEGAKKAGIDPNILKAFAATESGFDPNARNGSHLGILQFDTRKTWPEQMSMFGSKHGIAPGTDPTDPYASAVLGGEYLKKNMNGLKDVVPNPGPTEAYLTHFLGPSGAKKFLSQNKDDIAADKMPTAAMGNQSYFYKDGRADSKALTFGEVYQNIAKRVADKAKAFGISIGSSSGYPKGDGKSKEPAGPATGSDASLISSKPAATDAKTTPVAQPAAVESKPLPSEQPKILSGFDRSSPTSMGGRSVESGSAPTAQFNTATIEGLLNKSIGVEEEIAKYTKLISERLDPEALESLIGKLLKGVSKGEASTPEKDIRDKDLKNMGRTIKSQGSSLDFSQRRNA